MKIVLTTCGSRGDVQPMIALTLALIQEGHTCLLAGPPEKADWAGKLGCPYLSFGSDVTAVIDRMDTVLSIKSSAGFVTLVRQSLVHQLRQLPQIFKDADMVIASSLVFGASTIAQKMGIAYRYVAFTPQLFPSRDHPFPAIQNQNLSHALNRLSWTAAHWLDKINITWILNRFRKANGLDPIADAWAHVLGEFPIAACDKAVAKIPDDVAQKVTQTGYLHLESDTHLDKDIQRFIREGSPPYYAGFGSMPPKDQKKNVPLLIKAAKTLGRRIVISAFWQKQTGEQNEPNVFFVRQAPHTKLFPKMDLIIHHGGAGTTATATASGIPQVIIPHILDQYYHGQKIYEAGLGPKPVWRAHLNSHNLIRAMDAALSNPDMRQKALEAGNSIDPATSLERTVQAIEEAV